MRRKTWARLAIVAVATAGTLVGGGTTALADPPPGWAPGVNGVEYDGGDLVWAHHGRYADAPGNWHTGHVNVEESDDGITGALYDWSCPRGVRPKPADNPTPTACKLLRGRGIDSLRDPIFTTDLSYFDQARNRLTVHGDFSVFDDSDTNLGTVRIDLTLQGFGKPEISKDETGEILGYTEIYRTVGARGKVDGHRVHAPRTRRDVELIYFSLDGWERTQ